MPTPFMRTKVVEERLQAEQLQVPGTSAEVRAVERDGGGVEREGCPARGSGKSADERRLLLLRPGLMNRSIIERRLGGAGRGRRDRVVTGRGGTSGER
jgi:hypothetical protein